jgi:hypothetical protein
MAARLPRLIVLALLLPAGVSAQASGARDTMPGTQVITAETLRRAGATRLSDVLSIAHRWDEQTVDGAAWNASPLGGSPFLPAHWIVLVDGQRVDDDVFGVTDLDRLAVPLEQVSTVELIEVPRLVAGGITTDGLIRITTADPSEGPAAGGWFVTGSEIGDPGPFAFTPEATSNVDRLGHRASAGMSYGGAGWFATGAIGWATLVPTDPAIVNRYIAALGPLPRLHATTPSVRVGARVAGGRHEAVLRHSAVDGALGLSPFGTEIATDQRFTIGGLSGDVPLSQGRQLRYDVSHARNQARLARGRPGPPLDWEVAASEIRTEVVDSTSVLETGGLRLRRRVVTSPDDLADPSIELATAYVMLRLGGAARPPTASGTITVGEGDVGLAALLTRGWTLASSAEVEAILSYERRSRAEDNTIWAWTERGYPLLEESGADFEVVGDPRSPERLGADLNLSARPVRGITLWARALFRHSRGLAVERRDLHFVPATSSFEGPAAVIHDVGGELAGGGLELASDPVQGLAVRASWWVRGAVGGDDVFVDAWAAVPSQGARVTMEYVPVEGLDLWMTGAYRGAARQREFAAVEAESGGRYRARVGDALTVDLAVQKRLWDGRLRVHFGVRNLLGAEPHYHPAGATFGPTAILQLQGILP